MNLLKSFEMCDPSAEQNTPLLFGQQSDRIKMPMKLESSIIVDCKKCIGIITLSLILSISLLPALAADCPKSNHRITPLQPGKEEVINPNPLNDDIELPMPCGGIMVLRPVCIPAEGFFDDLILDLGCNDCRDQKQSYMETKRKGEISGPFMLNDLPEWWRIKLIESTNDKDVSCLRPDGKSAKGFYYFIGKYEITNFQWKVVMEGKCPEKEDTLTKDDPRPVTNISWFAAVEFTRRYTEWLLKNRPESLPKFSRERFAYLRLPTEAEWEYAARGGHRITLHQMNDKEFFPLNNRPLSDYAVFTDNNVVRSPDNLAWVGSKCPNSLGIFDMAGNAAEMVFDPFRFSLGSRMHGAAGGFVTKGGSYRKRRAEITPGRREEMPFYLADGAFRSTDLGFRIALSAILTPYDRKGQLEEEWIAVGNKRAKVQRVAKSPKIKKKEEVKKRRIDLTQKYKLTSTGHTNGRKHATIDKKTCRIGEKFMGMIITDIQKDSVHLKDKSTDERYVIVFRYAK